MPCITVSDSPDSSNHNSRDQTNLSIRFLLHNGIICCFLYELDVIKGSMTENLTGTEDITNPKPESDSNLALFRNYVFSQL